MKKNRSSIIIPYTGWKKLFLMARITTVLLFAGLMQVTASVYSQQTKLNLKLVENTLTEEQVLQEKTISGRVTDSSGAPLPGVTVVVKGTTNGTITSAEGAFSLSGIPENATLVFSFMGMKTQEVAVGSQTNINVTMEEEAIGIEELVVIGYGVQKKKLVTGATIQVKGEDLQKLSTTNPISAIQSMSPGISITQRNGLPDSGYKIYIRGLGTIGNASPLVIIDGFVGGDLNSLNPSDIESIDVLKDAASSAIYGARAANGVILVTTKQGKVGKATITYDGYYGVQNVQKMEHTVDALTYASMLNEALAYDGLPPYDYASQVPNWNDIQNGTFKGTEWLEEFRVKDAPIQNHSFNVTGGTEQSIYSIGFSYTSQEAIFGRPVNPKYDRYTGRVNTEHVLFKTNGLDIITFGENILWNYKKKTGQYDRTGNQWGNDLANMFQAPPFLPVKDSNGDYSKETPWYNFYANPIGFYYYDQSQKINENTSLLANAYLTIQPIRDLFLRSAYTYSNGNNSSRSYLPAFDLGGQSGYRQNNTVSQSEGHSTGFMLENTANYKFKINNSHNFDVLLGQSIQKDGLGSSVYGSNVDPILTGLDYAYLSNTKQIIVGKTGLSGSPGSRHQLASFFGRVNYDFKESYLASVTMRADGSSNFARGNRWGYFPSVSAGWVLTNESFMESTKNWLDFFKLRVSYGENGNESISNFQYLSTVSFSNADYWFGPDKNARSVGAYFDILPNEDITWESSVQTDIGFDSWFLRNRLGITFDYYIRKTMDWLVVAPALSSNGTGAPYINGGDIQNKGIELSANWNDQVGDFTYSINANASYNKNKVTRIANTEGIIRAAGGDIGAGFDDLYRAQVGYPIAYFYGYKSLGIFQTQQEIDDFQGPKLANVQPGDMIWVDTNKDGVLSTDDRTMIGTPHAKFRFGLGLNFGYKGFDLIITGYGVAGNDILHNHRSWNDLPRANFTTHIYNNRWHGPGTSNKYPRLSAAGHQNWSWVSTQFLEKGDFLRVDNVTIGYDFKKLLKTIPFSQARLYLTSQNLFTFTGYSGMDPEIGYASAGWGQGIDYGQVPRPRTFLVGVNIKF